jgi:hypothetical protein
MGKFGLGILGIRKGYFVEVVIKAGDFKKYQIEQLKVMLSSIEQGKALYAFIDETYKTFIQKKIGEGKVIYGIKYNIRTKGIIRKNN